jgi:LPPG:FO 2-phospho-L-lactate transferase
MSNRERLREHVVLLAGGVGGAKLAVGLCHRLPPGHLTILVNTGDDFEHLGLHVSPDLDTVMYSLAKLAHPVNGWGIVGDTFHAMSMIEAADGPIWFRLGDRDLGINLMRTMMLRDGKTLTEATQRLSTALGVGPTILPMSDDSVRTVVETNLGKLGFQEYFVRERWQPVVIGLTFEGADTARISKSAAAALDAASLVIIGPSNPFLSIDPILATGDIRERISQSQVPCIAVSPIIGGQSVKGPAAKIMGELGLPVSSIGVAEHYQGFLDGIVIDEADQHLSAQIEELGLRSTVRSTFMTTDSEKETLAEELMNWAEEITE